MRYVGEIPGLFFNMRLIIIEYIMEAWMLPTATVVFSIGGVSHTLTGMAISFGLQNGDAKDGVP